MENQILINKKTIKQNKPLKKVQKEFISTTKKIKSKNVKARLGKIVKLHENSFIDLSSSGFYSNVKSIEDFDKNVTKNELCTPKAIIDYIAKNDIVGLSGSLFPLAQKLTSALESNENILGEKTLIINAVECEISLLHDTYILNHFQAQLEKVISLLVKCGFENVIIATKPPVVTQNIGKYQISYVAARYPMGSEYVLIKELTGVSIPSTEYPAQKGIAVVNVQTALSLFETIATSKKNTGRFLTFADLTEAEPKTNKNATIVYSPYGTKILEVAKKVLGQDVSGTLVTGGGILSGHAAQENEQVESGTCFIGVTKDIPTFDNSNKCKMCGACEKFCPMKVKITKISHYIKEGNIEKAKTFNAQDCIQCGTCSYVCAAQKNLMQIVGSVI